MTVFNLAFLVRGEFLSLIQIFQIFEIVKLLFWETTFQRWKGNLQSSMCVCVCLSVCRETRVVLSCVEQMMKMLRTKRTWRGMEATQHQRHNSLGAKYGRYCYPGKKVIDVDNVPDSIRRKLPTTTEKYIIHWYTENNYSAIKKQGWTV